MDGNGLVRAIEAERCRRLLERSADLSARHEAYMTATRPFLALATATLVLASFVLAMG